MNPIKNMCLKYILFFVSCVNAAIIPEELPSLLSVAYSNIPPIKKGTDSRVGFGFSLGNHADFQVMFELGPQIYTNPAGSSYASSSKRHTKKPTSQRDKPNDTDAGKYLSGWSQNMKQKKVNKPYTPLAIPEEQPSELGTVDLTKLLADMEENKGEIILSQPSSGVRADAMSQLKQLYGGKAENVGLASAISPKFNVKAVESSQDESAKEQKKKITEELSDVSLDDE